MQAILDSAETLLAEQGYTATTLKAIGEHAGIPTASLYHYFADRGQVDTELVNRHAAALDEQFAAGLDDPKGKTLAGSIDAVVTRVAGYFRANTPLLAVELAFEAGDRLFDVAFQRSPTGDDATFDEAKRMLTAYLQSYAPMPTQPARAK